MDAIREIKQDHRRVESLFEQFETLIGMPGEGRTRLIQEVCRELTVHATVEEELLYPALARCIAQGEEKADHANEEHDEAKQLIAEIEATDPTSPEIEQLMARLKSSVMHHVQEEENDLLPSFEGAISREMLESLGQEVADRKQQLLAAESLVAASTSSSDSDTGTLLDLTKEELYNKAKEADIAGRSKMTKEELAEALSSS